MPVSRTLLFLLAASISAQCAQVRVDMLQFIQQGLRVDPRLAETRSTREAKLAKISAIKSGAILPKFELSLAYGPAPGLKESVDDQGDTVDTYDFTKIGPYFGSKIQVAQPLNLGQLQTGLRAARSDLHVTEAEIRAAEVAKAVELQKYYYGFLLAREMKRLTDDANRRLSKAQADLEESLEDDDPKVSQDDLLQLKAGSYELAKSSVDADLGYQTALLGIRFALGLAPSDTFVTADDYLGMRAEELPPLDTLFTWMSLAHPDLQKLRNGLSARKDQMELAAAKMGPEFFLFGEFEYAKSWAGDRKALSRDAFAQDPVNRIDGALGVGVRYKLNFWDNWQKYRAAKLEYRQLTMTDSYAVDGLRSMLELQYREMEAARTKVQAAQTAMRASDALLKGAAMRYDLDHSESGRLLDAYKTNLYRQKDYYFAVHDYNVAVAQLLAKVGWTPIQYNSIYPAEPNDPQGGEE